MTNLSPTEYKVALITQALDMAHDSYARHFNQMSTLREWTVTLLLGYLGFLVTIKSTNLLTILPFAFVLLLFMYLEAGSRARMSALRIEMGEIEQIFMEMDAAKFTQLVQQFEFRSVKDAKIPKFGIRDRLLRFKYVFLLEVVTWYLSELLIVVAAYLAIWFRII
ncbi:MAG: hypothetical protein FJ009_18085 [Chloroflexi bacterium]|nr:hypothetical protein [Chloroflexota bacterium]